MIITQPYAYSGGGSTAVLFVVFRYSNTTGFIHHE